MAWLARCHDIVIESDIELNKHTMVAGLIDWLGKSARWK